MSLHVEMVGTKYQADIDVAVNITNLNNPVTITATNVTYDPGFVPFGTINALIPMAPQMRVIWNPTVNNVSGILLQIGLSLAGLTDTIAIEDRSGVQSGWLLNTTTGSTSTPILPSDNVITLPDGASIWNNGTAGSTSVTQTLQNSTGFLLSASQVAFTSMDLASSSKQAAFVVNLPSSFRIQDIKMVKALVTDAYANQYQFNIPMLWNGTLLHGSVVVPLGHTNNLGVIDLTYNPTASSPLVMAIFGTSTTADAFSVRYLIAIV
jgi:hypothetical protein